MSNLTTTIQSRSLFSWRWLQRYSSRWFDSAATASIAVATVPQPLQLKAIAKSYQDGSTVLDQIELDVKAGEFVVLVGPSGCGKSTLLRLIAGLDELSSGEILLGGRPVHQLSPAERDLAMVFQDYALYPHKSVYDNLAFGLQIRRVAETEITQRVQQVAEQLQISELLWRKPAELSGGQRQRVAIGRALVRQAHLFLFDEPLSNLDLKLRQEMRFEIKKLHQQLGMTILYVTHDQVEAMSLADRIAVLRHGRIEQYGTPAEIYHQPASSFVAEFIGSPAIALVHLAVKRDAATATVSVGQQILQLPGSVSASEITLGIRAEALLPDTDGQVATVLMVETLGAETLVQVELAGHQLWARWPAQSGVRAGQQVKLSLNAAALHWFDRHSQKNLQFSSGAVA